MFQKIFDLIPKNAAAFSFTQIVNAVEGVIQNIEKIAADNPNLKNEIVDHIKEIFEGQKAAPVAPVVPADPAKQ